MKIPAKLLGSYRQIYPRIYMERQGTRIAKIIFEENELGEVSVEPVG